MASNAQPGIVQPFGSINGAPLGGVVTDTLIAQLLANQNFQYGGSQTFTNALYYWAGAIQMAPVTDWALMSATPFMRQATAGAKILMCPLMLPSNGDASFYPVTEVLVYLNPGGAGVMSCSVNNINRLNSGAGPLNGIVATGSSSGTGYQEVTMNGFSATPSSTSLLCIEITSANANDIVVGARVKIG